MTLGSDERLYGPTAVGGLDGGGTIITIDLAGTRTTFSEFSRGERPGRPNGVIQASDGQLLWDHKAVQRHVLLVTPIGTVFAIDAAGARTTLHTFFYNIGLNRPHRRWLTDGNLIEGADGNVYGTIVSTAPTRSFRRD